ncbi:hypothetical protein A3A01_00225 [Candidatus Nomurabacteria bacterium RIFCSPLOWO2_01_FULL_39_17]|uniref:Uncharacterized protein n=1 Tax=Candidatus Nomurabacteria bacterium RIFCSPLOWO2_01_FULL_39_17 TaxID=1801770 RepID=A0A1F6WWF7_9BACT|nr:MAG: hypothetical protein A3A01_00225 [Candidatus Nomurabacteria bacterium RIFCSPLOWO2_01_FULL_39_17]
MKKRTIIIVIIILIIVVVVIGYLFLNSKILPGPSEDISQIINQGVLPSLGESTNPMKNKPDVNPIDASNPFRSIKTNPFQ